MSRPDGRDAHDIRPIFMGSGCLSNAAVSAFAELGASKVIARLRGPQQLSHEARGHRGRISFTLTSAPYATLKREAPTMQNQLRHKELEILLTGIAEQIVCLESLPQLQYEINIEVVSSGTFGSNLGAAIAATTLCFANATIATCDVATVGSAVLSSHGSILFDPSVEEMSTATASCVAVVASHSGHVLYSLCDGSTETMVLLDVLDGAVVNALARRREVRAALAAVKVSKA